MGLNYIKHKIKNLVNINKIVTIHYYEFDNTFSFDGESHDFWEMVYIDAGHAEICADGTAYYLGQGELIFHKPGEFHTLKTHNGSANVFVISFVCHSENMNIFRNMVINVPKKLRRIIGEIIAEYSETFYPMLPGDTKLVQKDNSPIGGQQMIRTLLEQFIIMLIRHEQKEQSTKIFSSRESMENHLVSQIISCIESNLYGSISVCQICRSMSYSRTYLSKIFKTATGQTILEYMVSEKIKHAKTLIREDKYNFTQISDMLCFENPHYFSTVFKRITNMSPSEYKESVKSL